MLVNVRPRIEVMPLERADEAYRKLKTGNVKFRMVLIVDNASNAH